MILKLITKKFGLLKVIIDNDDLDLCNSYKLCASYVKNTDSYYIMTSNKKYLHRLIMNAKSGEVVDHINHNTLDNRKCNLRITTFRENRRNSKKAYLDKQKLSESQVKIILTSKLSNNKISKIMNVSNCLTSKIRNGKMYINYCKEIPRK